MVKPMIIYDNEEEFLSSDERFIGINDEIWQFVKDELHMTDENYLFDVENVIVLFSKAIAEKKFTAQQCIHYLLEREDITFAQVVIPELLKKDAANKFNQIMAKCEADLKQLLTNDENMLHSEDKEFAKTLDYLKKRGFVSK